MLAHVADLAALIEQFDAAPAHLRHPRVLAEVVLGFLDDVMARASR